MSNESKEDLGLVFFAVMAAVVTGVVAHLIKGELWISVSIGLSWMVGVIFWPAAKSVFKDMEASSDEEAGR